MLIAAGSFILILQSFGKLNDVQSRMNCVMTDGFSHRNEMLIGDFAVPIALFSRFIVINFLSEVDSQLRTRLMSSTGAWHSRQ